MKIIGVIAMIVDHIGAYLFPEIVILRIFGRLAFPLFAFSLVEGFCYSKHLGKYGLRLILTGIAAQPAFSYLQNNSIFFSWAKLNVCFTLALGLLFLYFYYRWKWYCLALLPMFCFVEYGLYAASLFMIFNYYLSPAKLYNPTENTIKSAVGMAAAAQFFYPGGIQIFSLLALTVILCRKIALRIFPRWQNFYYVFFPAHLIIFMLLVNWK